MEGKACGLVFACTGNLALTFMGEGLHDPMGSHPGSMSDARPRNALADISRR
jgi:hypothetical protein